MPLKYVKVLSSVERASNFPDFLILGPQRTGTTWLYENLKLHPQIMMPRNKELHYFSTLADLGKHHQTTDLIWYLSNFYETPKRRLGKTLRCIFQYGACYTPSMYGEACASYAALDSEIIRDIAVLNPRLKVIMIVRDPVLRAWSHAKKDLMWETGRSDRDISEKEYERFFSDEYVHRCSLFTENIDRWTATFGSKSLFVGWFSDIKNRPSFLLSEIMRFLGVSGSRRYIPAIHRRVIYSSPNYKIPPRVIRYLEEKYSQERLKLGKLFGRFN